MVRAETIKCFSYFYTLGGSFNRLKTGSKMAWSLYYSKRAFIHKVQ